MGFKKHRQQLQSPSVFNKKLNDIQINKVNKTIPASVQKASLFFLPFIKCNLRHEM